MATDAKPNDVAQPPPHRNQPKSIAERLMDRFLQESSIQWMLVMGAAIISASSLMLVTRQWTSLPTSLKFLTIVGYTAATYASAEYCGRRMRLHATSQVLRCLTLILIPIGFLSLAWLTDDPFSLSTSATTLLLLVPATGLMVFATDRIFSHWLHGRQYLFVAAYMLLCLAGALPVIDTTWLAALFSTGFWLVMTIGVVNVNRHLFWLAEEHRLPRVFGFLPIAILTTQCVVLLITKTIGAVPFHWVGLGLVMLAGTVLMTTKTIADVFRQRTGNLIHPLPWSIMGPLFVGLTLTAAGVLFSFHGFSFSGAATRAAVPSTLIAAGWMLTIARDTRHRGFAWVGLILITIAYQSCPTLLGDVVRTIQSGAASAVQESRLPVAFYGLTYLPLLAGFALASRWFGQRDRHEFRIPLKRFVSILSVSLTLLSLTHWKAAFVVNTVGVMAFMFYGVVLRERRCILAAIGCLVVAAGSFIPFASSMHLFQTDMRWSLVALSLLGIVLSSSAWLDQFLSSSLFEQRSPVHWFRIAGHTLTVTLSAIWVGTILGRSSMSGVPSLDQLDWIVMSVVILSLFLLTVRLQNYLSGMWMWLIALAAAGLHVNKMVSTEAELLAVFGIATGVVGLFSRVVAGAYGLDASPRQFLPYHLPIENLRSWRRVVSILRPLADLTLGIFALLANAYFLPTLLWATVTLDVSNLAFGWPAVGALIAVGAIVLRHRVTTATAWFFAPIMAGAGVGVLVPQWFRYETLPLVYAMSSAGALAIIVRWGGAEQRLAIGVSAAWLAVIAPLGMLYLSPLVLASSIVAILALLVIHRDDTRDLTQRRTGLAIAGSLQGILAASMLAGFRGFVLELPASSMIVPACVWMLAAAVIAVVIFEDGDAQLDADASRIWGLVLRALALLFFMVCFVSSGLASYEKVVVIASLVIAAGVECHAALRRQQEEHVWGMGAVIGLIAVWLHLHPQVSVLPMLLRLGCVSAGGGLLVFAHRCAEHPRLSIFVRTATVAGLMLPLAGSTWSVFGSSHGSMELLIIFSAAAIWFVHGRVNKAGQYVAGAAVILNIGLCTLFASWSLSDAQIYLIPMGFTVIGLVELLRVDIPRSAHDPLRYLGGLAILVSPCFEILGGSWLHIASLMILSVLFILIAIGLRLRALIHLGTAFLCVDLVAMVIRSSIDHPGMLWVTGLVIGASVIAIGATCEHYRESLLSRIRILSDELSTWQ